MTSVRRLVVAVTAAFALGFLGSLVVRFDAVATADRDITRRLHERAVQSDALREVALDVTTVGDPITLTALVAITAGWLFFRGHGRIGLWLIVTTLLASIVNSSLKVVVARSRPDFDSVFLTPLSKSFPSGHALNTTVVFGAITIAVAWAATSRRSLAVPVAAATVALAVGVTRPVLGVHFASDVVAGWVLGVLWLVLTRPREDPQVTPRSAAPSG
ncbi:MAG: phosphatase PAP2 family protein [Acidimicrobiales bacterium]|nr:phosphatase PAP2 family protein [Acidimicrobiales bacterium]